MMKTVLVIGGGGREHAIVDALSRSPQVGKIYCAPGNAGIAELAECVPLKELQIAELKEFAIAHEVDLTVVGPEVPLSAGIADEFRAAGLRMARHNIPTAAYRTFSDFDAAWEYVRKGKFPVVLKYDGLAAGKGVVIPETPAEAEQALKDMLLDECFGKGKVVVEEFLTGPEFSFMCFVDGLVVTPMVLSQDHKRAFEGDKGPNTGGMGAYSPVPIIPQEDIDFALEHILKPVAAAMVAEGCPFQGVLYGGLMKTADGPKVIEFNCRFGDPETEVVLPRLLTDIYDVFSAVADGTPMPELSWSPEVTMGFVMASKGYPGSYQKGFPIVLPEIAAGALSTLAPGNEGIGRSGRQDTSGSSVRIYHMGTKSEEGVLKTAGGRVLMVVGSGKTLQEAHDLALETVRNIQCDNLFYRSDIGWRVL